MYQGVHKVVQGYRECNILRRHGLQLIFKLRYEGVLQEYIHRNLDSISETCAKYHLPMLQHDSTFHQYKIWLNKVVHKEEFFRFVHEICENSLTFENWFRFEGVSWKQSDTNAFIQEHDLFRLKRIIAYAKFMENFVAYLQEKNAKEIKCGCKNCLCIPDLPFCNYSFSKGYSPEQQIDFYRKRAYITDTCRFGTWIRLQIKEFKLPLLPSSSRPIVSFMMRGSWLDSVLNLPYDIQVNTWYRFLHYLSGSPKSFHDWFKVASVSLEV
jgi:hypothetical protein